MEETRLFLDILSNHSALHGTILFLLPCWGRQLKHIPHDPLLLASAILPQLKFFLAFCEIPIRSMAQGSETGDPSKEERIGNLSPRSIWHGSCIRVGSPLNSRFICPSRLLLYLCCHNVSAYLNHLINLNCV